MSEPIPFTPEEVKLAQLHMAYDKHAGISLENGLVYCPCGLILYHSLTTGTLYPTYRGLWNVLPKQYAGSPHIARAWRRQSDLREQYDSWEAYQAALSRLLGYDLDDHFC